MKTYRCPYCGEKAFSLMTKWGIYTKFDQAPRCPHCKRFVFRSFLVGGHWLYYSVLGLAAFLSVLGCIISNQMNFTGGIMLSLLFLVIFYLVYHYYFCHFDRTSKNDANEPIIYIQLKETKRIWPRIRQGEIYELFPLKGNGSLTENDAMIAMLENIKQGKLKMRLIHVPANHLALKGELILLADDMRYVATMV